MFRTTPARPLSESQRAIWLVDQLTEESPLTLDRCWVVARRLDRQALRTALDLLVARHDALRTAIATEDGLPVARHEPGARAELEEWEEATPWRLAAFFARPLRLSRAPALRVGVGAGPRPREDTLALRVHHALCDGPGLELLLRELAVLLDQLRAAGEASLPPPPAQQDDYLDALAARLASPAAERARAFWTRSLTPPPTPAQVPADHPRRELWTARGRRLSFRLPRELADAVDAVARRCHTTPFAVLLAAVATVVSASGDSPEVVLAVPVAGRALLGVPGLVGMAANLAALRIDLRPARTFAGAVGAAWQALARSFEHSWVPIELVSDWLGVARRPGAHPLSQVIVTFADERGSEPFRPAGATAHVHPDLDAWSRTARTDLTFDLTRDDEGLRCGLEYSTELFRARTAERIAGRLEAVLAAAMADPDRPLGQLDPLPPGERATVLRLWNATDRAGNAASALDLIEARAAGHPSPLAVVGGGGRLRYGELLADANRLGRLLRRSGVGPETRVGICLERTPAMVAALLATWKAGGAYVPLEPSHPPERLRLLAEDAGIELVVAQRSTRDRLPARLRTVLVDGDAAAIAAECPGPFGARPHSGQLSHVIFTSGSTGTPRGVLVTHGAVANLVGWALDSVPMAALGRVLASTSLSFDLSVFELFVPLAAGTTVVLANSLLDLWDGPPAAPVTLVNTVPSVLEALLRAGNLPRSTRFVALAGEPLPRALVDRLHAAGVAEVRNLYGPSETTTYSTQARLGRDDRDVVAIGTPLANTRAYVLDAALRPSPIGAPGELYLAGAGLARAYHGRPGLTADRFGPDPFSDGPGERMYRTGDRARWRPDGQLEFLGRRDHQVKVDGHRIELGEVEAALTGHPAVAQAVSVVEGGTLAAYVTGPDAEPDALRAHLAGRLPGYLVPSRIAVLAELPRTANGKVDRARLAAAPRPSAPAPARPAADAWHELVERVWREVLGVDRVDPDRNFFEHGGTSMLLTRVHLRLAEALPAPVPLVRLFQHPTVHSLAGHLREAG